MKRLQDAIAGAQDEMEPALLLNARVCRQYLAALTAQPSAGEPVAWMGPSGRRVIPAWYKKEVLAAPAEREGVFDCTEVGMEHVRRAVETYTIPLYPPAQRDDAVVVPRSKLEQWHRSLSNRERTGEYFCGIRDDLDEILAASPAAPMTAAIAAAMKSDKREG